MTYTPPASAVAGAIETAADFNLYVIENIKQLYAGFGNLANVNLGADVTTTSTSFANIDASLSISITVPDTCDLQIGFNGWFLQTGNPSYLMLDVTIDGVAVGGDDGLSGVGSNSNTNIKMPGGFTCVKTGVTAGAHTIAVRWKVSTGTATMYAGAGTANGDVHPQLWVRKAG